MTGGWGDAVNLKNEIETLSGLIIYILMVFVKYILGAFLFIWAINTLFNYGIPFSLKTGLASMALIWLSRLFLRGLNPPPLSDPDNEAYYEPNKLSGQQIEDTVKVEGPKKNKLNIKKMF